jgi:anti-anti-sigma regulatory factor
MNLIIDETGKNAVLNLEGNLTIERIAEIKENFMQALKLVDKLVIDHSRAAEFDFTYLQLLISAHRTFQGIGKEFSLANSNVPGFLNIIKASGFPEPDFCSIQEIHRG